MAIGVLAVGLLVMSVLGIASNRAPSWLLWVDLLAAVFAMGVAVVARPREVEHTADLKGLALLSVVLSISFIAGLMMGITPWLMWSNFGFSFAFFYLAMSTAARKDRSWDGPSNEELLDEEIKHRRDRWSA